MKSDASTEVEGSFVTNYRLCERVLEEDQVFVINDRHSFSQMSEFGVQKLTILFVHGATFHVWNWNVVYDIWEETAFCGH
ncbi:MAG: hypothetical protein OXG15_11670 [Gammaproteobacteria bacterium]|nr:hypothetical protein [Gammaproteobacteria bacterium]